MRLPLRIGEQTTHTDPDTREPVRVHVTAGEGDKVPVIVGVVPESTVKVTAPPDAAVVCRYKMPHSHAIH